MGEWAEKRRIRDQLVFATKYSTDYKRTLGNHMVNYSGNSTKSLYLSVEAPLKKLRMTYIDILYVHWWDTFWNCQWIATPDASQLATVWTSGLSHGVFLLRNVDTAGRSRQSG